MTKIILALFLSLLPVAFCGAVTPIITNDGPQLGQPVTFGGVPQPIKGSVTINSTATFTVNQGTAPFNVTGSSVAVPGVATESTLAAISTTTTALKARADLLATEATLVAISTTASAIKARADLLASEATAAAISSNAAAGFRQGQLIGNTTFQMVNSSVTVPGVATESTLAGISTTTTALKQRADLLATEATEAAISTTAAAIKARADLLATEATAAAISSNVAAGFRQGQSIGNTSFIMYQSSPPWQTNIQGPVTASISSGAINIVGMVTTTGTHSILGLVTAAISSGSLNINGIVTTTGTANILGNVTATISSGSVNVMGIVTTTGTVSVLGPVTASISSGSVNIMGVVTTTGPHAILGLVTTTISSAPPLAFYQSGGAVATTSTSTIISGQTGGALSVTLSSAIPSGSNTIGAVNQGGFWYDFQYVQDGSGNTLVAGYGVSQASVPVKVQGGNINVTTGTITVFQGPQDFSVNNSSVTEVPIQKTQAARGCYFATTTNIVSMAVAETPLFLFVNVATNTTSAYVDIVEFINANIGTGVGASNSVFRVYRAPVVTSSGTALGEFNGDSNSTVVSKMQSFLSPTLSSNGTLVFTFAVEGGTVPKPLNQSRIIRPGAKIAITVSNTLAATPAALNFGWSEE